MKEGREKHFLSLHFCVQVIEECKGKSALQLRDFQHLDKIQSTITRRLAA